MYKIKYKLKDTAQNRDTYSRTGSIRKMLMKIFADEIDVDTEELAVEFFNTKINIDNNYFIESIEKIETAPEKKCPFCKEIWKSKISETCISYSHDYKKGGCIAGMQVPIGYVEGGE